MQGIFSFSQSIQRGIELGLISDRMAEVIRQHGDDLERLLDPAASDRFEYFGLRTVYDRYLLKHPKTRQVIESPQYFFLRVATALGEKLSEIRDLYGLFSRFEYMTSSPTLFNSGTKHEQLSSCFLLDSPSDHLESIYRRYTDIALLSKFSGGIGLAYHRVRSRGSLIESTNGHSNGIVPWLKTLDASVAAVNQGGKRKGACCVYLETWHADIEEFLELRDNTGDEARRTHNLNLANWISDLFMKRVEGAADWSLFDPKDVPHLTDLFGDDFESAYVEAEQKGLAKKTIPARELYARMMRTLAQTGNGWMTFKDKSNKACNQTALPGRTVHLSNLCTEILEVTSSDETAVCNLGSINVGRHLKEQGGKLVVDFEKLAATTRRAIRQLDRVIDLNYYPIASTKASNNKWRPVGLGLMGLQDVFFQMRLPFDGDAARKISQKLSEHIYFHALSTSAELAEEKGPHVAFPETRAARGELQFDAWGVTPDGELDWEGLRLRIQKTGLRNSLSIAIAPTATIASIAGCYECIEPQVSNLFKRETLSGDFLQVNRYLVRELEQLGMWNESMRGKLKMNEGSVQGIDELPSELKLIYRTAWEVPMRSLIDMAAERGAYIDQSQSLNLFVESPNIGRLSSMYMYAWKKGIKTTYYLRSRPATRITKTTVEADDGGSLVPQAPSRVQAQSSEKSAQAAQEKSAQEKSEAEKAQAAVVCSLENPESCEACQ
ncbi:MAG TPA: ribonucleoside-diphosphate reductase subunit alpha, partial [Polyangiaceae bacterium]|nr:ribonucleoside-diphosphate reductase subunit alpha [Polyangiaceae bacterium]